MKKISTVRVNGNMTFKRPKLTIGLDLGDRWSFYCVRDKAGEIILEQKLPTTPEAMKHTFERIPRSLIALERSTRLGEILWPKTAQVWHTAGEPRAGRGIERGVARGVLENVVVVTGDVLKVDLYVFADPFDVVVAPRLY